MHYIKQCVRTGRTEGLYTCRGRRRKQVLSDEDLVAYIKHRFPISGFN